MSNLKALNPDDIDETLVKLIEHAGKHHVLLLYVDATGAVPEFRSLGRPTDQASVRMQDLTALAAAMRTRTQGTAVWFILFNTPWLYNKADADAIIKSKYARR